MTDQPPGPVPAWTIDRIETTQLYQVGKGAVPIYRVHYVTATGTESWVELPIAGYTAAKAAAAIDERVTELLATHASQGQPIYLEG